MKSATMDDDFSTIESKNLFSSERPFNLMSSRFNTMEVVEKKHSKNKFNSISDEGKRKKVKEDRTPLHNAPNNPISEKRSHREAVTEIDLSSEMNSLDTLSKKSRHKSEEKEDEA